MDQATQQNAALVEESAAAAESLKHQAQQLVEVVAVFKLSHQGQPGTSHAATPAAQAPGAARRAPNHAKQLARPTLAAAPAAAKKLAPAPSHSASESANAGGGDWASF